MSTFDKTIDAITGAPATGGVVGAGVATLALDPSPVIQWGTALIVVLTVLTYAVKLWREVIGVRIDKEKLEDARNDDA